MTEYPGGYHQLRIDQTSPSDYNGLPQLATIDVTETGTISKLYVDREPTSVENGYVYYYFYDKDLELTAAADVFPFKDVVFRALVPAVAELWKRYKRQNYDAAIGRRSMGRAVRYLTQTQTRSNYGPNRPSGAPNSTDPFGSSDA